MGIKILWVIISIAGIVTVFFVSWFWRLFLIPIILLLAYDVASSVFKGKKS